MESQPRKPADFKRYADYRFANSSNTSAWHGLPFLHQHARFLPRSSSRCSAIQTMWQQSSSQFGFNAPASAISSTTRNFAASGYGLPQRPGRVQQIVPSGNRDPGWRLRTSRITTSCTGVLGSADFSVIVILSHPVKIFVTLTTQRRHSHHSLLPHRFCFRLAPTALLGRIPRVSEPSWRRMVSPPRCFSPPSSHQLCGPPVLVGKPLSRKATLSGDEPQNTQNNKAMQQSC